MKDYKLLLAGLALLLLLIVIAVFTWLWIHNRKNIDPLPIMANQNEPTAMTEGDAEKTVSKSVLYVQIEENLQAPLDEVIVSFESRYPNVQVMANYVPATTLLTLPNNTASKSEHSNVGVGTDMIVANDTLTTERLAPLQAELKNSQKAVGQKEADTNNADGNTIDNEAGKAKNSSTETRTLNSFSYALKDEQALEGVILTDNTAAINFRNFLVSSVGQDILKKYDYDNIEGYKNSVNDLFNPTSQAKQVSGDTSVDVADALSNGE
ncbi:hypothetical protein [Psychrobacter vallis]|uniref:hypothetical protein n=1 Tax=Psychrobacter vallis TaxID=248451 RepID=UPI00191B14F7|nr:hypothetical protein [Psychrobacter vallis]